MKKQILLAISALAFIILISCDACISSSAKGKQDISVMYTEDTSKLSQLKKNQLHIIKNQEEMLHNQDTIKENLTNNIQQDVKNKKNMSNLSNLQQTIQNNNKSIYEQLEKTQNVLKIQQKEIDSMIIIHKEINNKRK